MKTTVTTIERKTIVYRKGEITDIVSTLHGWKLISNTLIMSDGHGNNTYDLVLEREITASQEHQENDEPY